MILFYFAYYYLFIFDCLFYIALYYITLHNCGRLVSDSDFSFTVACLSVWHITTFVSPGELPLSLSLSLCAQTSKYRERVRRAQTYTEEYAHVTPSCIVSRLVLILTYMNLLFVFYVFSN